MNDGQVPPTTGGNVVPMAPQSTAVAGFDPQTVANYYEAYGQQADRAGNPILKFIDGYYLLGQNRSPTPYGSPIAVDMQHLEIGWLKFQNETVVSEYLGLLLRGYQPYRREELGDLDASYWEVGTDGRPRDPWAFVNQVPFTFCQGYEVDGISEGVFSTSSKGGIGAIGRLCKLYGDRVRIYPETSPIVLLEVGQYEHKEFRRFIKFPNLRLVAWQDDGPQPDASQPTGNPRGPVAPQAVGRPVQSPIPQAPQMPAPGYQPPMQGQPQHQGYPPQGPSAPAPYYPPQGQPPQNYAPQQQPPQGQPPAPGGGFAPQPMQGQPQPGPAPQRQGPPAPQGPQGPMPGHRPGHGF